MVAKKMNSENSKKTTKSKTNNQNSSKSKESKPKKTYLKPKKDFTELNQSKYVQKWLVGIKSHDARLSKLFDYCNFTNKTPETLILEHRDDLKLDGIDQEEIAKKQMHSFFGYLTDNKNENFKNTINDKKIKKDVSQNSARQYVYSVIASFYKRNKVPVVFEKKEIPIHFKQGTIDKNWRNGGVKITAKEEKECLKQIRDTLSTIRDRAILLCKISSGMDDIDLINLKYKDFDDGYYSDPKLNICYIQGHRIKNRSCYYQTFFSSEACNVLHTYFKERAQKGEEITFESDLFVKNRANSEGVFMRIERRSFSDALKEATNTLGLNNITPKGLRRWFSTTTKGNVKKPDDNQIIERMMGHAGKIGDFYQNLFNNSDRFAQYYKEYIEYAILLGNGDKISKEHTQKIENLTTTQDTQAKEIEDQKKKIKKQKALIDDLKEQIDDHHAMIYGMEERAKIWEEIIKRELGKANQVEPDYYDKIFESLKDNPKKEK